MKSYYKKAMWLLDEDVLVFGYKDKYGFHPQKEVQCGFGLQKITKRDLNRSVFPCLKAALNKLNAKNDVPHLHLAGGTLKIAIDSGMAITKYMIADYWNGEKIGAVCDNICGVIDSTASIRNDSNNFDKMCEYILSAEGIVDCNSKIKIQKSTFSKWS